MTREERQQHLACGVAGTSGVGDFSTLKCGIQRSAYRFLGCHIQIIRIQGPVSHWILDACPVLPGLRLRFAAKWLHTHGLNPKPLAPLKAIPDPADIMILHRRIQSVASKGSSYVSMRQCHSVAQNDTLNLASCKH